MADLNLDRLVSAEGFIEAFYEQLRDYQASGQRVTNEDVFDALNNRFMERFGVYRFPSYNAFRKKRDRMLVNGSKTDK